MTAPTIRFERRGTKWAVNFAYDPKLVEWCKTVPSWARTYDPPTKTWLFERQYGEQLATEWKAAGCHVVGMEAGQDRARRAPPPPPPRAVAPPPTSQWATLLLARADELDPALGKALFRAIAKVMHADVGGDHVMMQELNIARKAHNEAKQQEGRAG